MQHTTTNSGTSYFSIELNTTKYVGLTTVPSELERVYFKTVKQSQNGEQDSWYSPKLQKTQHVVAFNVIALNSEFYMCIQSRQEP